LKQTEYKSPSKQYTTSEYHSISAGMMNEKGGIIWTMRRSFLNHVSIDCDDDIRSGDVALAFMTRKGIAVEQNTTAI